MNHQYIYDCLIQKRQQEPATGYTERHHILPRSMGGSDDPSNLVVLTGREHWIAHLLLWKIHRNAKMIFACNMMAMRCEERGIPRIKNSRSYEMLRKEYSVAISNTLKSRPKEKHSCFKTRWVHNPHTNKHKKINHAAELPENFIEGISKELREKISESRTGKNLGHSYTKGKNNPTYNKTWICNPELKANKLIKKSDPIPEGWERGMIQRR